MSSLPSPVERKQSAGGIGRGNRWRTESRWNDVRTGLKVRKVMIDETTVDAWSSFRYSSDTAGRSIDGTITGYRQPAPFQFKKRWKSCVSDTSTHVRAHRVTANKVPLFIAACNSASRNAPPGPRCFSHFLRSPRWRCTPAPVDPRIVSSALGTESLIAFFDVSRQA